MMTTNPMILLSIINTKLRDSYSSLETLCEDLDEDKEEIVRILGSAGYFYDERENQFKQ